MVSSRMKRVVDLTMQATESLGASEVYRLSKTFRFRRWGVKVFTTKLRSVAPSQRIVTLANLLRSAASHVLFVQLSKVEVL